jgi:hypothetical protein
MRARHFLYLGLVGSLASCARLPRVVPSRAACPTPSVGTSKWVPLTDSAGVSFRLPADYREVAPSGGARHWELGGDFQQYVTAGFIASSSPPSTLGRAVSPGMLEMTECIDSVGGREVLVQAWRTRGGTFRNGRRLDRYDVFAVVPVRPDLRFYFSSGGFEPRTQKLALAAVRTIVVDSPRTTGSPRSPASERPGPDRPGRR